MTVLADHQIRQRCWNSSEFRPIIFGGPPQDSMIRPYDEEQVEPASYDVRLGNDFKIFERDQTPFIDFAKPADISKDVHVEDGDFFLLHPGEFVLGVTVERLSMPNNLVARIEGKSSIGRLGLMVHVTAGYIDPGFRGPVTLEMIGLHPLPLKLRPGMLIGQISFHEMSMPAENPYHGRYQDAKGVEASRYGMQPGEFMLHNIGKDQH